VGRLLFACVPTLAALLAGCGVPATVEGTSAPMTVAAVTVTASAMPSATGPGCDAIRDLRSVAAEVDPWQSPEHMVRNADAVLLGEVVAVEPIPAAEGEEMRTNDGVVEPARTVFEASLRVAEVLVATEAVEAGQTITVWNGSARPDRAAEPCLLMAPGDVVLVGVIGDPATSRVALFNLDSVFYVDGDDVRDTGRGYGGITELEAMTPEALRERLVSADG
jgi:hypothetical protein